MWDGIERRIGPDWLTKIVNLLNAISWLIFVVALAIFHYARPEINYIILHHHGIAVREYWILSLKQWMLISLYLSIALSCFTLGINRYRVKRKSDHNRYNIVILVVVILAFLGVVSFG